MRESRNPFRFECHGPKGGIFTPGLAKARAKDHVTTLYADPGRLLFRLGRNIYEETDPPRDVRRENVAPSYEINFVYRIKHTRIKLASYTYIS